jgi:hypothetical protein
MAKNATDGTTGTANGETKTPRTRQTRSNHAVAASHPITDAASAGAFATAAIEATAKSDPIATYNNSGFVTPGSLNDQTVANRLRMTVSLINSLASAVAQGGDEGAEAKAAMGIIQTYCKTAAQLQIQAEQDRILAQARQIQEERSRSKS